MNRAVFSSTVYLLTFCNNLHLQVLRLPGSASGIGLMLINTPFCWAFGSLLTSAATPPSAYYLPNICWNLSHAGCSKRQTPKWYSVCKDCVRELPVWEKMGREPEKAERTSDWGEEEGEKGRRLNGSAQDQVQPQGVQQGWAGVLEPRPAVLGVLCLLRMAMLSH